MAACWKYTTRLWRILQSSKAKETARAATALALCCLLMAGGISPAAAQGLLPARAAPSAPGEKAFVLSSLSALMEMGALTKKPVRMDAWYLHPAGMAFRVPEGFTLVTGRDWHKRVMLMDESSEDVSFRATIGISLTDELEAFTQKDFQKLYASGFDRFVLRYFAQDSMFGEDCTHVCFTSGASPQLLYQQYLFNKGGAGYVITLTMENRLSAILSGLEDFRAFCDSMVFAQGENGP